MKVVLKKRKLFIFIVVIFLLLSSLIALYIFYQKSTSLDSTYYNIYKDCKKESNNGTDKYICDGFLREVKQENDQECFTLYFISSQNSLFERPICNKIGFIQWDNVELDIEKAKGSVYPVEVIFTDKKGFDINEFNTPVISISRITDDKTKDLLKKISTNYNLGGLMTYETEESINKGYSVTETTKGIGHLYFRKSRIKEINIDGDRLSIKFTTMFNGKEKDFITSTTKFSYIEDTSVKDPGIKSIDVSNYTDFDLNSIVDLSLIYIPESSSVLNINLETICSTDQVTEYPICIYPFMMEDTFPTISDVDSSLQNSNDISKSIILYLAIKK